MPASSLPYVYRSGLESNRLRTRWLNADDALAWATFMDHPIATELFPPMPGDALERANAWIARQLLRNAEHRYGMQALIDKETGQFVGMSGLLLQIVDGETELEVGYHMFPEHWGKGYAPEAARLFLNYGFDQTDVPSIISIIDVRNQRSKNVAGKNGLQATKTTTWSDLNVCIYRIQRTDWNSVLPLQI